MIKYHDQFFYQSLNALDWFGSWAWMIIRYKLKKGEGKLEAYNPEVGSRSFTQIGDMASPRWYNPFKSESDFLEAFATLQSRVEELYKERGLHKVEGTSQVNNEGGQPLSSFIFSSSFETSLSSSLFTSFFFVSASISS